jgi:hypothetical protein
MIDTLPDDVINLILNNLDDDPFISSNVSFQGMSLEFILSLRNINKFFKGHIEKQKNIWSDVRRGDNNINTSIILNRRSDELDKLCLKKTPCYIFKWLFENNINLTIKNIEKLIITNRCDVFKQGFHNGEFLKILFNRFHLCQNNDILSLSENISPVTTAVKYDRLDIIKLLLETSTHGNPYLDQIESIFEDSIKFINKGTLNYLIVNHYDKLQELINRRINTIILRFHNIEDILFYIFINKKVAITREIMNSIISKKYFELFKYCYHPKFSSSKNNSDFLVKCIGSDSFIIFDYLMENKCYINQSEFSAVFLSKKKHNIIFLNMILDKYTNLLTKRTDIISMCINNKVDSSRIEKLVDKKFTYNEHEIIKILELKDMKLAKIMINSFEAK